MGLVRKPFLCAMHTPSPKWPIKLWNMLDGWSLMKNVWFGLTEIIAAGYYPGLVTPLGADTSRLFIVGAPVMPLFWFQRQNKRMAVNQIFWQFKMPAFNFSSFFWILKTWFWNAEASTTGKWCFGPKPNCFHLVLVGSECSQNWLDGVWNHLNASHWITMGDKFVDFLDNRNSELCHYTSLSLSLRDSFLRA